LQIGEDFREGKEVRHRVIANWGRLDIQRVTGSLDSIATSLAQLSCEEVAKSYKSLWEVESVFRTLKDVLEIRPIFHRKESHVKGHVFCSYRFASLTTSLALCLLIAFTEASETA
jgi:transposase